MRGSDSARATASRLPIRRPHCGPPSSLSPEQSTRSAPAAIPSATVGSPVIPAGRTGEIAPEPMSSIVFNPARSRQRGKLGDVDRLGEPHDPEIARVNAEEGGRLRPDRPLVVGDPGPVGRADFAEPGARDLEDLGQSKAAADLDELSPRDDNLPTDRQRPEGEHGRPGVVVDHRRRLGPGQLTEQGGRHRVGATSPLARLQVELEVAIAPSHCLDRLDGLGSERRAAETGVQQDPGRVQDASQGGPRSIMALAIRAVRASLGAELDRTHPERPFPQVLDGPPDGAASRLPSQPRQTLGQLGSIEDLAWTAGRSRSVGAAMECATPSSSRGIR